MRCALIDTINQGERKNILKEFLRPDFSHSLGLLRPCNGALDERGLGEGDRGNV